MTKMQHRGFSWLVNLRVRRVALVCLLTAGLATLSACSSSQKKQDESLLRLRLGTSYLQNGGYPQALRELLIAEKLDPKNEVIQNNLGLAYFMREKPDLALKHLARALELRPDYSEARNNYARTLIELARYDEAVQQLNKVLADLTYADPAKAWINLGLAYFRKGDFRTAKEKFAEAVKISRNNCIGQTLYGRSLLELADYQGASTALDNAVMICKTEKFEEPFYFSGLSHYKLGRTSSAIARMEEVIKMSPDGEYAKKAQSMLKLMK